MVSLQMALVAFTLTGASQNVMLDFYGDYCGPCRAMMPTIEALEAKGYSIQRVNVSQYPAMATKYQVHSIPCFVMLANGREVDRVVGGTTLSRLERMFQRAEIATTGQTSRQPPPALAATAPSEARPSVTIPAEQSTPSFSMPDVRSPASIGGPLGSVASTTSPSTSPPPMAGETKASTSGWTPRNTPESRLLASSVRLRVEDPDGQSCGSGTIIDSRQGEALILTCAHLFRDSKGKGRIEVDLFGTQAGRAVPGRLVSYDMKRDVGLVAIQTPVPVTVAHVAPPGYQAKPGAAVVTVGCNNGDRPTVQHSRINACDKFVGPANLEVAGQPVEGRSGGGLFSQDGLVIGVCNAADPEDQEGLYAALESIHAALDDVGLTQIYRPEAAGLASQPADEVPRAALVAVDPPPMPEQMPQTTRPSSGIGTPLGQRSSSSEASAPLGDAEQAALDEIRQKLQDGAEVVCVIRSRQNPTAKSEIIMLDKVSPSFLRQLAAEALAENPRHLTSLTVPRKSPSSAPTATQGTLSAAAPTPDQSSGRNWSGEGSSRWQARRVSTSAIRQ